MRKTWIENKRLPEHELAFTNESSRKRSVILIKCILQCWFDAKRLPHSFVVRQWVHRLPCKCLLNVFSLSLYLYRSHSRLAVALGPFFKIKSFIVYSRILAYAVETAFWSASHQTQSCQHLSSFLPAFYQYYASKSSLFSTLLQRVIESDYWSCIYV